MPLGALNGNQWQLVGVSSGHLTDNAALTRHRDPSAAARWDHGRWMYRDDFAMRFDSHMAEGREVSRLDTRESNKRRAT